MRKLISVIFFLSPILCLSQTEGIGFSALYNAKETADARNEALFNAQENAAINAGGVIGFVGIGKTKDSLTQSTESKTKASFNSARNTLGMKTVNAVVKTIGTVHYDTLWDGRKYKVRAQGKFMVDLKAANLLLPGLDELGEKVMVEVVENDCSGRFYDYSKQYFAQKQNSIFLSRQKFLENESDFKLEIFTDHISLINTKARPNITMKIYPVKSCNEIITGKFDSNEILDSIREEIFVSYILR